MAQSNDPTQLYKRGGGRMLQSVSRDHFRCLCCSQSILGMQFLWPQRLLPVVDFVSSSCYLPLEESSLREDWLLLFAY